MSNWDHECYLPHHKENKDHTWADAAGCAWANHGCPWFLGQHRRLLMANETHSHVGGEWSRAYHCLPGHLHPMQLNNGGTCSDPS